MFDEADPRRNCYPMTKEKLGNVYIFSHTENQYAQVRYGSVKDCRDLEEVFQKLKFDVTIYHDLVYKDILEALSNIAKMDYSNYDCLIIFVLTHGNKGKIFAEDTDYYPDIYWKSFNETPSLMNKPKLIFIQAPSEDEADGNLRITPVAKSDRSVPTTYSIPYVPDVLLMYCCYDAFVSWRNPITGSSFIQSLCHEFKLRAKNTDLLTLLTFVNRKMSIDFMKSFNPDFKSRRNMPTIISTLNKILYFAPINK